MKRIEQMGWLRRGAAATAAAVLLVGSGFSADAPNDGAPAKLKIEILKTPDPSVKPGTDVTGEIKGKVSGLPSLKGYQVVVYSKGGQTWYVQPDTKKPLIKIDDDGEFSADIYGGTEYGALLVKDSYQPKATLDQLPVVGGGVIARDRKKPEKPVK